jgi:threonine/homoserine/homoserine lactone efflux protein
MITTSSFTLIAMGAFFGLSAGLFPGPLLTLVITETLKHSRKEGIKIAMAPLITDLPIILIAFFIFSNLSQLNIVLGLISILGGSFFTFLGYETVKTKSLDLESQTIKPESLKKGITANLLNPHPYVFWMTIGIPTGFKAWKMSPATAIFYFLMFYLMLVGSKIGIAFLVERSKTFLKNRAYKITMQILAIVLFLFAVLFFYEGIKTLLSLKT